jgi:hypothetical protein
MLDAARHARGLSSVIQICAANPSARSTAQRAFVANGLDVPRGLGIEVDFTYSTSMTLSEGRVSSRDSGRARTPKPRSSGGSPLGAGFPAPFSSWRVRAPAR